MDDYKSKQLENTLRGKRFKDLTIQRLLDNGKSAAVFLAENPAGQKIALKIFDNEIIDRFGHEIQERRIRQEIDLKGHNIANLIRILDGGQEIIDSVNYFFIAMPFVDGVNLKNYIKNQTLDSSFVKNVTYTLYKTAEELLKQGIAHRDIKPENIMISNTGEVILMDLGVLKLIGTPSFSDIEDKQFVGTLRYAPPEFLTRQEQDSNEGWQAINHYQIGAVMHDMIMKHELFEEISPYSNLVIAIKEDAPFITSEFYSFETVQLCRDLLTKDPQTRLKLTQVERIVKWAKKEENNSDEVSKELEDLLQMTSGHKAKLQEISNIQRSNQERKKIREDIAKKLTEDIVSTFSRFQEIGGCKQWFNYPNFRFESDRQFLADNEVVNILFEIKGDLESGFSQPFHLLIRFIINEQSKATIQLLGILLSTTFVKNNQTTPQDIFRKLDQDKPRVGGVANVIFRQAAPIYFNYETFELFNGILVFDKQFENRLIVFIVKMVKKAVRIMEPEVKTQIDIKEKIVKRQITSHSRVLDSSNKLISNLD